MSDLISRQAVINALEKEKPTPFVNEDGSIDPFGAGRQNQWYRDGIAIMNLPSAQSTVEAIPIEWIEKWIAYWERILPDWGAFQVCAAMLKDWEKENGTRNTDS